MIYFTSDLHLGHKNILKHDNRLFRSIEEMDNVIIKRWNNTVNKDDTVYILGDISWHDDNKTFNIYNGLNGQKILITGNHDRICGKVRDCFISVCNYKKILIDGTKIIMSHYPIHFYDCHYHGAIMLYGHVHNSEEEDLTQEYRRGLETKGIPCKMYNVGCMLHNYTPRTLEEIKGFYGE